jgi:4-hydroxy-tetrahydrodipicolinate synthase
VIRAAAQHANIAGVKDSGGDFVYFQRLVAARNRERPDWSILVGPEELLGAAVLMGGDGGVSGGSNVLPRLYVSLYDAARNGRREQVHELQARVLEFSAHVYRLSLSPNAVILGLKAALAAQGICGGRPAAPLEELAPEQVSALRDWLNAFR